MKRSSSVLCGMAVICGGALLSSVGALADEGYQKMQVECTVLHGSYRGVVVAPGALEATGPVKKLTCNGNVVELESNAMSRGRIKTKSFGDVDVHLSSTVSTVGAATNSQLPKGKTLREKAVEVYVPSEKVAEFTTFIAMK